MVHHDSLPVIIVELVVVYPCLSCAVVFVQPCWNQASKKEKEQSARYLEERLAQGCRNANQLWEELKAQGFRVSAIWGNKSSRWH